MHVTFSRRFLAALSISHECSFNNRRTFLPRVVVFWFTRGPLPSKRVAQNVAIGLAQAELWLLVPRSNGHGRLRTPRKLFGCDATTLPEPGQRVLIGSGKPTEPLEMSTQFNRALYTC